LLHGDRLRDVPRVRMEAVDPVALARRVFVWEVRHAVRAPSPADVLHVDEGARRAGLRVHVPEGLTNGRRSSDRPRPNGPLPPPVPAQPYARYPGATMRRLPIVGLAISVLLVPIAASASVPDPAVTRDLVGGSGPVAVATAIGDVTGDGVPDLIVARGADVGPDAYTVAVFDGPLSDPLPTDPSFVVTPTARSDAYQVVVGDLNHDGLGDLAVADVNGVDALDKPTPGIDVFLEPNGGGDIPSTASDFMSP